MAWPGVGLLDRGLPTVAPVAPAPAPGTPTPTPRLRPLRPLHAAPGQSAVVIQDPPLGLPGRMYAPLAECKETKFGPGGHEFEVPSLMLQVGDRRISWFVYPLGPVGSPRYQGPWANIQTWTQDLDHPKDPGTFPFVEVYGPQVRVHLSRQNGRKGTMVGPYSIVQPATTAQGTAYKTLAKPTGAQVAIAWDCDAPPGTARRESPLPRRAPALLQVVTDHKRPGRHESPRPKPAYRTTSRSFAETAARSSSRSTPSAVSRGPAAPL